MYYTGIGGKICPSLPMTKASVQSSAQTPLFVLRGIELESYAKLHREAPDSCCDFRPKEFCGNSLMTIANAQ